MCLFSETMPWKDASEPFFNTFSHPYPKIHRTIQGLHPVHLAVGEKKSSGYVSFPNSLYPLCHTMYIIHRSKCSLLGTSAVRWREGTRMDDWADHRSLSSGNRRDRYILHWEDWRRLSISTENLFYTFMSKPNQNICQSAFFRQDKYVCVVDRDKILFVP